MNTNIWVNEWIKSGKVESYLIWGQESNLGWNEMKIRIIPIRIDWNLKKRIELKIKIKVKNKIKIRIFLNLPSSWTFPALNLLKNEKFTRQIFFFFSTSN